MSSAFFADITQILPSGRSVAYRAIDSVMVETCWRMGQNIVEEEQQGTAFIRYLREGLGNGFSAANLKDFRQFYVTFPDFEQVATHRVATLAWSYEGELGAMLEHEKLGGFGYGN